jgi:hypothetical protein
MSTEIYTIYDNSKNGHYGYFVKNAFDIKSGIDNDLASHILPEEKKEIIVEIPQSYISKTELILDFLSKYKSLQISIKLNGITSLTSDQELSLHTIQNIFPNCKFYDHLKITHQYHWSNRQSPAFSGIFISKRLLSDITEESKILLLELIDFLKRKYSVVILEGVETGEQFRNLADLGCCIVGPSTTTHPQLLKMNAGQKRHA